MPLKNASLGINDIVILIDRQQGEWQKRDTS